MARALELERRVDVELKWMLVGEGWHLFSQCQMMHIIAVQVCVHVAAPAGSIHGGQHRTSGYRWSVLLKFLV